MKRLLCAALALASPLIGAPQTASAAPGPPVNLEPVGGLGWQAERDFELGWTRPPGGPEQAAVRYVVLDREGALVEGPRRVEWPGGRLEAHVSGPPGVYTVEARLEDMSGALGPPASAPLRFDDTRPPPVSPIAAEWVGRAELPYPVGVTHPAGGEEPPAGIRGYAISIDRDPDGRPCAGTSRCTDAETDLRGGPADDSLPLEPPDGAWFVHAVAVSGSGMRSRDVGTIAIHIDRLDPTTALNGAPEGWVSHSVVLHARAADVGAGMQDAGAGGPFTAIRVDGGAPTVAAGATASATVSESGAHRIAYYARDAAGNVDDGAMSNGRANAAPRTSIVRIDRESPRTAFLPATHPEDPELIEARVDDALSGPSAERGWIGVRGAGSGERFDPLPTSVENGVLRCRWNSQQYPDGQYEFEAVGYDRAGNTGAGLRRQSGAPMILSSPLKTGTRLSGRVVGHTFRGRLEQTSGAPLAGMPVEVVERFPPSSGLGAQRSAATTGGRGGYVVHLSPGSSREIVARFAGSRTKASAATPPASLEIHTRIHLRASSRRAIVGGRPIVFSGSIAAGEVRADDVSVQLQFKLPGRAPWTEFRTVETDRRGHFRYLYRFSDDDSRGVRFLFRAFVPGQDGWPYAPGGSLPVWVLGQ